MGFISNVIIIFDKLLAMLHYMTERATAAFLRPELMQRLANMLNYWLVRLVKCLTLLNFFSKKNQKKSKIKKKQN